MMPTPACSTSDRLTEQLISPTGTSQVPGTPKKKHLPNKRGRYRFDEVVISSGPKRAHFLHQRGALGDAGNQNPFQQGLLLQIPDEVEPIT